MDAGPPGSFSTSRRLFLLIEDANIPSSIAIAPLLRSVLLYHEDEEPLWNRACARNYFRSTIAMIGTILDGSLHGNCVVLLARLKKHVGLYLLNFIGRKGLAGPVRVAATA